MRKHHRQSNSAHLVPGKSSRTDGQGSFGGREDSDPSKNAVGCLNAYEQGTTSSGSSSAWDDDASSVEVSEESGGSSVINVDFGVFDMRTRDVDASMHLLDQLCPDKMNEVDRDALGAALHANPFTCVVRVDSAATDDNDDGDEEEEEGGGGSGRRGR
ncbi:putative p21 C terminal region binding protein [Trypanosoma vivax]|nr:putative p21 C terminal region binding protein [Trypanosoma vivax]